MLKSPLIDFYLGQGVAGTAGYTLEEIQNRWTDKELEYIHDYIQWLFPLVEKSAFNAEAPILDERQIEAFKTHEELRQNLIHSFKRMLLFYGFQCDVSEAKIQIYRSPQYAEKSKNWLHSYNHNYLRITRILKSLRLLGLEEYALAFFEALKALYAEEKQKIGERTYHYWSSAVPK